MPNVPSCEDLSNAELEQRLTWAYVLPPSVAFRQLETIQQSVLAYGPDVRSTMYRQMLVTSVVSQNITLSHPEFWGREMQASDLASLFLRMPLLSPWSVRQRKDVLDQVEEHCISSLQADWPEDVEFWRRMYYALVIRTYATDEVLAEWETGRPPHGLHFTPRGDGRGPAPQNQLADENRDARAEDE